MGRWLLRIGLLLALWQLGATDRTPAARSQAPLRSGDEASLVCALEAPRIVPASGAEVALDAMAASGRALAPADAPASSPPVPRASPTHTGPPIYLRDAALLI